jgi:hypothetical protein
VRDEVPRRHRQRVELAASRRVAGVDLVAVAVEHETGHRHQVALVGERLDERRHHFLAVADRDDVEERLVEPVGLAGGVVAADDDEGARHLALHALGEAQRPLALGREVALQADDVGVETAAGLHARLLAVDAQVEDGAGVPEVLEGSGDADQPERLDEGEHLEAEDSPDGRLEEGDLHAVWTSGTAGYCAMTAVIGCRSGRRLSTACPPPIEGREPWPVDTCAGSPWLGFRWRSLSCWRFFSLRRSSRTAGTRR